MFMRTAWGARSRCFIFQVNEDIISIFQSASRHRRAARAPTWRRNFVNSRVHEGVVDCGFLRMPTTPLHEGVVDLDIFRASTTPFHEGVVDLDLEKKSARVVAESLSIQDLL